MQCYAVGNFARRRYLHVSTGCHFGFHMNIERMYQRQTGLRTIPRGIWALGFVSLFMDISSEMIHGLLPVFLTSVLGASTEMVGLIEGVGEATASISKLFSGWVSDKLGKRKALTVIGYGLGALSKPFFALAPTSSLVLAARFFGPGRKRHTWRSARCHGGGHGACWPARCSLRSKAGSRYRGCLRRTAHRDRANDYAA